MKIRMNQILATFTVLTLFVGSMAVDALAVSSSELKPTDVYLVLDNSSSMKKTDPEKLLEQAANQFFNATPSGSSVGVITFSKKVEQSGNLTKKDSANDVLEKFTYDQTGIHTNIGTALTEARDRVTQDGTNTNKAIVLITDGNDTEGENYNITSNGNVIPVYCVYIHAGDYNNDAVKNKEKTESSQSLLSMIAKDSGTGDYLEISSDSVESTMDDICREIYGTTFDESKGSITQKVTIEENSSVDIPVVVDENVYMASGTIEHTDAVALKIVDPKGTVLYDADDDKLNSGSDTLSVEAGKTSTSVTMMWPDEGTYSFTVSSETAQDIELKMIPISTDINLEVDTTAVKQGSTVTATCSPADNSYSIVNAIVRVHDAKGNVVIEDIEMTDNGDGTFSASVDLSSFDKGETCSVVGIAETETGNTLASSKAMVSIKSGSKFPIFILLIIVIVIVLIAVIVFLRTRNKVVYTRPMAGVLRITIRVPDGKGNIINNIPLPIIEMMPEGKPIALLKLLEQKCSSMEYQPAWQEMKEQQELFNELGYISIACLAWKKDRPNHWLEVYYETGEKAVNVIEIKQNSDFRENILNLGKCGTVQFAWGAKQNHRRR